MKTKLLLATTLLLLLVGLTATHYYHLVHRLRQEREGLLSRLESTTMACDSLSNACEVIRLDREAVKRLYQNETKKLKALEIKLRRVETMAQHITQHELQVASSLRDSLPTVHRDSSPPVDVLRHFSWSDPWNRVEGIIRHDSVYCRIKTIDTLHQVVHRIPRRFLFIRWGTKALRQEIHSSNPSTRIIYTDYVVIAR